MPSFSPAAHAHTRAITWSEWPETPDEVRELVAREVENSPPFWQLKKNAPQLMGFDVSDREAFWISEFNRVTEYWRNQK